MSKKYRFGLVLLVALMLASLFAFAPGAMADGCVDGHDLEHVGAKAATCTEAGNIEYWHCKREGCGKYFSDEAGNTEIEQTATVIGMLGHDLEHVGAKAATCTEAGNIEYWHCKREGCGKYFSDAAGNTEIEQTATVIGMLGHDLEHVGANDATCTTPGNIEYWHCKREGCGKYFSDAAATKEITQADTVIPAGHDLEHVGANDATCTTPGNIEYWHCKREGCGKYFSDAAGNTEIEQTATVIGMLGHDLEHVGANAATCTAAGNIEYWHCKREGCGKYFSDAAATKEITQADTVIPAQHDLEHVEAKAATCTEAGNIEYWHCKREGCGKYFSDEQATTEITQEQVIIQAGHDWGEPTYAWAEDFTACTATRVCTRDASHFETETVAATVTEETAATYTTEGKRVYTTGAFANTVFAVQTKEVAIPKLVNYITAIDKLSNVNITYKPELKAALTKLPASVQVTLSDETKVAATLTWTKDSCPTYKDKEGDGKYVFTPAAVTTEAQNPVAEGVALPTCTMVVGAGKFSDDYADYTYRKNEAGEVTITKCAPKVPEVVVPATIDGSPVTYIGDEAFKKAETLTHVTLPMGLLSIGNKAFYNCTALETVVVPDSLQAVGTDMFKGVKTLANLTLVTDLESTLTAQTTVAHTLIVDEKEVPYEVEMPAPFTDILVNTAAFTIDCDYTVATGHALTVNPGAILNVAAERTLKNLGTVTNSGTINNSGKIVTCGGTWINDDPVQQEGGAFVTTHVYVKGVCTGCGAQEEIVVTQLSIAYTGSGLDKVYDKTRNVTVTGSDFRISGTRSDHTAVRITGIRAAYDSADVGDRKITISFTLGGDDAAWYTCEDITVKAKISPKALIITPNDSQQKFYGAADPTYFTGTVKGLLQGDTITGRLARESGENVGKYKILQGTIAAGDNYDVQVQDAYFVIEAKSINSTDVGLVTIGNQRYTGQPIKPTITLRYGTLTLKQDTDFKAEYTDNVKVGTAKVKMTGTGNYTGERETSFRILDVDGGGGGGGGGGSGSDDDDDDDEFGSGSDEFEDEDEEDDTGRLIMGDEDYGDVLINSEGEPQGFTFLDDTDDLGNRVLTIMPDPMTNESTGESLYLDEDNMRERYNESHLRVSPTLAKTLADKGISEIVYQMDQADVHIPLASLVAELPLETPETEETGEAEEGGAAGDEEVDVAPEALHIASYDICLEQVDAIRLTDAETRAALVAEGVDVPGPATEGEAAEAAEPAEPADDETETQLDPRVAALLLSERETAQLDVCQNLIVPAYRVRVRVILEGQTPEPTGLKDDNGDPLPQMVPKALPDGVYPKDIVMTLMPDETPNGAPETMQTVRASVLNTPWDPNEVGFQPAAFEELDGIVYAMVPLERDGLYALNSLEPPEAEEDYEDDGFDDEDSD